MTASTAGTSTHWFTAGFPTEASPEMPIDSRAFCRFLADQFPGLEEPDDVSLTLSSHQLAASFARLTQAAIDSQDRNTIAEHFELFDQLFIDSTAEVRNAIKVSYLGNLRFDGPKAEPANARELLPPALARSFAQLEDYLARLMFELRHVQSKSA